MSAHKPKPSRELNELLALTRRMEALAKEQALEEKDRSADLERLIERAREYASNPDHIKLIVDHLEIEAEGAQLMADRYSLYSTILANCATGLINALSEKIAQAKEGVLDGHTFRATRTHALPEIETDFKKMEAEAPELFGQRKFLDPLKLEEALRSEKPIPGVTVIPTFKIEFTVIKAKKSEESCETKLN